MSGTYSRKTIDVGTVHTNLEQNIIQITEDRLKLILNEHVEACEKRNSWIAPLGILITFLAVFATTDFKEFFLQASEWKAIFIVLSVVTAIWLIRSILQACKSVSVEDIIDKVKRGES